MRKCIGVVILLLGFAVLGFAVEEGVLTVVATTDPPRLDPAEIVSYEAGMVTYSVYEPLLAYDPVDFSIKPLLATSWELDPNGQSILLHLREDATFHDGTPFNAEAVKFSLDRARTMNLAPATYLQKMTQVDIIDDYTIKLGSDGPWAFLGRRVGG